MTSTVLPDFLAQLSAAAFTAAVSASPELPIMILRFAGPAFCVAVLWLLNPLPPPHAESASDPAAASASATDLRCACRDVIRFLHCRRGCPRGSRSRPPAVSRNGRCCPEARAWGGACGPDRASPGRHGRRRGSPAPARRPRAAVGSGWSG